MTRKPLFIDVVTHPPLWITPVGENAYPDRNGPSSTMIKNAMSERRVLEDSVTVHNLCQAALAAANPPDATADSTRDESERTPSED